MKDKNRFSILLEQLMTTSELKNYTLAQELRYDVSYISKWVSGRMLPAEKISDSVLRGISHCIVTTASEKNLNTLFLDYQVFTPSDVEEAIYDNLVAEYNYVKNLTKSMGTDIAPKTLNFSELTLPGFISKMQHPSLRRVKSLDVVAAMDLLSMDREYRLQIAQMANEHLTIKRDFPEVRFSLLVNLEIGDRDYIYDAIFLINMLTNFSHINFQLYGGVEAYGKIVFVAKDAYSISGMLYDSNQCISVTVSEEKDICKTLYNRTKALYNREMLLFLKVSMENMLSGYDYLQSLLSTNLRWLLGRMTEHFIPDDLFEDILDGISEKDETKVDIEKLRLAHSLTKSIFNESEIQIMVYESAFTNFAVSGELDFYNHKIILTTAQRLRYMKYVLSLFEKDTVMKIKMIHGTFVTDYQYITNPCLFLSDGICYMRLNNENFQNNVFMLNGIPIKDLFEKFYEESWNYQNDIVVEDRKSICETLNHVIQSINFLSKIE